MRRGLLAFSVLLAIAAIPLAGLAEARGPISILGNRDFTPENGVVSGEGTIGNPYIISGWEIAVPAGLPYGVRIENVSDAFVLRGLIIQGATDAMGSAIRIGFAEGGTIEDSTISGSLNGIELVSSTDMVLRRMVMYVSGRGLRVTGDTEDEYRHTIDATVLYNDYPIHYYFGIDGETVEGLVTTHITVAASRNVTVTGNEVVNGDGIHLAFVEDSVVSANFVYRTSPVYTEHGIHLYRSTGNAVLENSLRNNRLAGIQLSLSNFNDIETNQLLSNDTGIRLVASDENRIAANVVFANVTGIGLTGGSSANEIVENIIYHENTAEGISLEFATANRIERNGLSDCEFGLILGAQASDNRVLANTIVAGAYGISVSGSFNWIEDNLVTQQGRGVLFPETYGKATPRGNQLIGNVFADNAMHVYLNLDSEGNLLSGNLFLGSAIDKVADQGTDNLWTVDGLGNYWGGSELEDGNADGIGDTPIVVYPSAMEDTAPIVSIDPRAAGVGILSTTEEESIILETGAGELVEIPAMLANEGHERWAGFRGFPGALLDGFPGIFFAFESDEERRFTMSTVPFDLDIVFFDESGEMAGLTTMTANSDDLYTASGPFRYALELPGGMLSEMSIDGDARLQLP